MREQMRATDTTLRNIESHPEGYNALRRAYESVQVRAGAFPPQLSSCGQSQHTLTDPSCRCMLWASRHCKACLLGCCLAPVRTCLSNSPTILEAQCSQEPLMNAAQSAGDATSGGGAANPFAALFQPPSSSGAAAAAAEPATSGAPNAAPLPNPWAPLASGAPVTGTPATGTPTAGELSARHPLALQPLTLAGMHMQLCAWIDGHAALHSFP